MSGKLIDKVKYFMGLDVFEEEEVEGEEEQFQHQDEMTPIVSNNKKNKILNIHTTTQMKVIIYEPSAFDEASGIVDNLKNRKPVIINLENVEPELAKKFFDFLNGAIYALDGNIQKVSTGIFILAPNNVDISGNIKEELKNKGVFPWQK
ncbi:cell division protein SepF [Clostridium formicaceticum]|uniref:Cell division protein SepF n=1 Tax=Clostridium formicaceticum TaxID=1497 RepID=A0AAC9RMX8_9CLOT|nr:cell division protein SepF [Clostridium formicaceticum]AOY77388.1 cell division protein SepF [Clostridium formicaceticum]ARE87938.1 Cell division protein SepF [Clostridium formicaceticum]